MLKHIYSAPEAELLRIRLEQNYLASPVEYNKDENTETFIDDDLVDL